MRNRPALPQDNAGVKCNCLLCQEAEVTHLETRRVPADEFSSKPRWLHGHELKAWYEAREQALQEFEALKQKLQMPPTTGASSSR